MIGRRCSTSRSRRRARAAHTTADGADAPRRAPGQVEAHAAAQGLVIVGYYHANERADDVGNLKNKLDSINYLPDSQSLPYFYSLTVPQRSAVQERSKIIYETTKSYYELVALKEKLIYMQDALDAVESASELTNRMLKVGNLNELAQLKQNKSLYKKRLEYNALQNKYIESKERFVQRMNFDIRDSEIQVEARLPEPAKQARQLNSVENKAIEMEAISNPPSVQVRSNARISYDSYIEKYQRATVFKNQILPNQKRISEEKLLRYNGMLIDVFHLLEDAEDHSKAVIEYIDANLAFLIQSAQLENALIEARMDFSNINVRQ